MYNDNRKKFTQTFYDTVDNTSNMVSKNVQNLSSNVNLLYDVAKDKAITGAIKLQTIVSSKYSPSLIKNKNTSSHIIEII